MREWSVKICSMTELESTLNLFEKTGFTIDSYERITEDYDGGAYCVVGFREVK